MSNHIEQKYLARFRNVLFYFLPSRDEVKRNLILFVAILVGGILISPFVYPSPFLGWDWYAFFTAHNPAYNINLSQSPYPPFTRIILSAITWMEWRRSFSVLVGITLMTVALGTWKQGGRYGSIILALLCAPVYMLFWAGHPDGLALLGVITGVFPLTLMKPQITFWSIFSNRKLFFWSAVFLLVTLIIWPFWFLKMGQAPALHEAAFGWYKTGWGIAVIGMMMLAGAGNNIWRLMAAGALLSPHLLPYHLVVLVPAIGKVQGYRKVLLCAFSWLLAIGLGMGGPLIYLNFVFPIAVYVFNHSFKGYVDCVTELKTKAIQGFALVSMQMNPKSEQASSRSDSVTIRSNR